MKVIGEAQLAFINPDGSLEPVGPPVKNDICWPVWRVMFMTSNGYQFPTKRDAASQSVGSGEHWRIFYGANDCKQTPLNSYYTPDGVVNVDQDTPYWTAGATVNDPDVVTFTGVIQAPVGSPRTIKVLGLQPYEPYGQSLLDQMGGYSQFTILRLNPPCTQATDRVILITYRLYLYPVKDTSSSKVSTVMYSDIRRALYKACTYAGSTSININTLQRILQTTSFDLDQLPTFGLSHYGDNANQMEMTDWGGIAYPTWTNYPNVKTLAGTWNANDVYTMGMLLRNFVVGGDDIAVIQNNYGQRWFCYENALPGVTSPLQNVFPQRNTPPGPFQDLTVGNTATMTGTITLDASAWTDPKVAKTFRIRIVAGTDLSTATYQVDVMQTTAGFIGNRWQARTAMLPQKLEPTVGAYFRKEATETIYESNPRYGAVAYRTPDGDSYVVAGDCTRTTNGISIYNVKTGRKINLNASSTPALPVTAVADIECAKGYIFVACANTGLWRVNPTLTTVQHLTSPTGSENAYQLSAKNDSANTLWAMMEGGLCKLSNPNGSVGSLTWTVYNPSSGSPTFTAPGITDGNWSNVCSMAIDPDNLGTDQFLFLTSAIPSGDSSSNNRRSHIWWDTTTGVVTNPASGVPNGGTGWTQANLLAISDSLRCAGNRWMLSSTLSTSISSTVYFAAYGSDFNKYFQCTGGTRAFPAKFLSQSGAMFGDGQNTYCTPGFFVTDTNIQTISNGTTMTASSPGTEFALRNGSTAGIVDLAVTQNWAQGNIPLPLVYLPNSNLIFSFETRAMAYGVTPFMLIPSHPKYNTYVSCWWKSYGWDGSQWVLNNPGAKPVHAGLATLPGLDGLQVSFANGVSGTSFVAGEFWTSTVTTGLLKDNGTTYNYRVSLTLEPTQRLTLSGTVPQSPLGLRTDEPVTFSLPTQNNAAGSGVFGRHLVQSKGTVVHHPYFSEYNTLVSDQVIPASTDFDLRFKWITFMGNSDYKRLGMWFGDTWGVHFRYNGNTGQLMVYNNNTLVGTAISSPSVDAVCQIVRIGNTVSAYYNGTLVGSVTDSRKLVVYSESSDAELNSGWWDMKLTYTENRRVMIVGDQGGSTGYYHPKFAGLSATSVVSGTQVYLGSGSPLTAQMDFTASNVDITGTGIVKVATGAGWLVFHDSEPAAAVSGYATAHHILSLQP